MRCFSRLVQVVLILVGFGLVMPSVKASHAIGQEIFYSIDENGNLELSLVFYRDCNGIAAPTQAMIYAVSDCGDSLVFTAIETGEEANQIWSFLPFGENEVVMNCPSSCNVGSFPGVERFVYTATGQLPNCNYWRFTYDLCCASASINNIVAPGSQDMSVSAYAYLTPGQVNSSPRFIASTQIICTNSSEPILQSAYDADGDSLVYSFCPLSNGPAESDTMTFVAGTSFSQPFLNENVTLDSNTGSILNQFTNQSTSLIGIRVDEYRNGVLIGIAKKIGQLRILNCTAPNSLSSQVVQGNVVSGVLEPTVGSQVTIEYTATVTDPENYYIYCTTCSYLENYTWTTATDIQNGIVTATLSWIPVANELEVPLHVRLLQESCNGDFSSTTMFFNMEQVVTDLLQVLPDNISVYPNPNSGLFRIESGDSDGILGYDLTDIAGRILSSEQFYNRPSMIQVNKTLNAGIYLLVLEFGNGQVVKQFVVD